MAHWHDFNPWATELVYVPDFDEFLDAVFDGEESVKDSYRQNLAGKKFDCYLLYDGPLTHGFSRELHAGIRYGADGPEYYSPYIRNKEVVMNLLRKYGPEVI